MKDKFSIFSPQASKADPLESSINFKKSPNKFAVYEPSGRGKDLTKSSAYQSFSTTNLDNIKKLSDDNSYLRQTLNFKTADFDGWMHEEEKDKAQKSNNILRQAFITKPNFKTRNQKAFSESFSGHGHESNYSNQGHHKNEVAGTLGYSKKGESYLGESKSWHSLYDPRIQDKHFYDESRQNEKKQYMKGEWAKMRGEQTFKKIPQNTTKQTKILEHIQILKKIASNHNIQEQQRQRPRAQRKLSYNMNNNSANLEESQESLFRKKIKQRQEHPIQCYTPKLPKYTYEQRFKKTNSQVGSPTSTNNSDSRSPPNKFVEVIDPKKKSQKVTVEDFNLLKNLGEGKFGIVTMARHKKSGSLFALKKIPKALIKSHLMIDQLALQIRLQTCLNHKNILGIYGFFDDASHLFIVLQYMEQGTLYAQLKKNKILAEKQAADIVKQITQAVEYLHDHDIAHRDIKPENIVISNNTYKICDFGWATLCHQRRKTYCGTFDYAAPQILEGKEYDMSVDLWCLGVLTYELLTGKAPFYHYSRKQTMKKILNVETEAIIYPETMSKQSIDFIQKLVRKNPNERMKATDALKHPFLKNVVS